MHTQNCTWVFTAAVFIVSTRFLRLQDGEVEDVCSASPARIPKLQLVTEQSSNAGSHQKKISHIQGQRRNPSKMIKWTKSHLESNPILSRDTQRAQTNLVSTRTQRPHRDWARAVFERLLRRCGSAVDCRRGRGSGCSRPGCGVSPLGGGRH